LHKRRGDSAGFSFHQVGKHRFARIVHLATTRARRKDVAQFGQRNIRAMLGYQAGFWASGY
jgi:hypothetical protein